ncbi:MAG: FecR domain-containing protein [Desulfatitalea sp.]
MTNRKWRSIIWGMLSVLMVVAGARPVQAGEEGPAWVSKIVSLQGEVLVKRVGEIDWRPVILNDFFYPGDAVRVAADSRAALVLSNETVLRVDQWSTLVFKGIEAPKTFLMELLEGAAFFFSRKARSLKVATPFVNGVVEGTEFYVRVDANRTTLMLYEGSVRAENLHGEVLLAKGQTVVAAAGQAPRLETVVRPRDAVQWALYYPPIVAFRPDDFPLLDPGDWRTKTHRSAQLFEEGQPDEALAAIAGVDASVEDAQFYAYRAGLRLSVGQVDAAQQDIARAQVLTPQNSAAMALRAIIAVVQNRKEDALADAQAAVQMDPASAAARVALSYALQARFDLEAAVAETQNAVASEPDNAVAWARLAELRLSLGDLDAAIEAAQRAADLPPALAHTQSVLGFAYLTQIKTQKAQDAFHQAITLDSAAPLPRLGLGLAKIREGHLDEGRAEIEIAAALDPDNALIRSYLGKAYFDEKRGGLDQRQFEMAKGLDPNDPTPWFYDAIRKQTLNRPGEALQDMQQAIELNDNRAVYRSRLLLDDDLAARSAALGRIYSDLSFQELALNQGYQSLESDPANYSAHRLLADMYASRPRHEIARVSELLQSQLLQPLNLTPVQPQLAESGMLLAESAGPENMAFNEFNPLFTRNRATLQLNGVAGEMETYGGDATLAGLYDRFSYSAGYYRYETDGFRENNDLTKDIYDLLTQIRISATTSLQLEYRQRKTDNGDLMQRFDPEDFSDTLRKIREEKIPRLGLNYKPTANQQFIVSLIYNQTDYRLNYEDEYPTYQEIYSRQDDIEAYSGEAQYLLQKRKLNLVTGAGYYQQSSDSHWTWDYIYEGTPFPGSPESGDSEVRHSNAYVYTYLDAIPSLKATMGLSGDAFDDDRIEADQLNPKLGLSWQPIPKATLRAAAFRTLKRSLVSNQTIEPTQIAGFNQFFDDPLATDAKRYGIGVDYQFLPELRTGVETIYGDLTIPVDRGSALSVREATRDEWISRLYVYWLFSPQWAISMEYRYEKFLEEYQDPTNIPRSTETHFTPITLSYFHPSGFFAKIKGQYIHQDIEQYIYDLGRYEQDDEDMILVDTAIGYRFPRRLGILSLTASNVFDTDFNFYDTNMATESTQTQTIQPARQILLKATFSF